MNYGRSESESSSPLKPFHWIMLTLALGSAIAELVAYKRHRARVSSVLTRAPPGIRVLVISNGDEQAWIGEEQRRDGLGNAEFVVVEAGEREEFASLETARRRAEEGEKSDWKEDQRTGNLVGSSGNEDGRDGNEDGRAGNEDGKAGNEDGRAGNLVGSSGNEDERAGNEDGRAGNEDGRAGNEDGRAGNEDGTAGNEDNKAREDARSGSEDVGTAREDTTAGSKDANAGSKDANAVSKDGIDKGLEFVRPDATVMRTMRYRVGVSVGTCKEDGLYRAFVVVAQEGGGNEYQASSVGVPERFFDRKGDVRQAFSRAWSQQLLE